MADQTFPFQSNHGGIQHHQRPSNPNQRFFSDPLSLFEGWIAPKDPSQSDHDQFPSPSYELQQPLYHENHISAPPTGMSELDQLIHGQLVRRQPVTVNRSDSSPDSSRDSNHDPVSALFDLLRRSTSTVSKKQSNHHHHHHHTIEASASTGLSTEELIRIAGARFIQSSSQSGDLVINPFDLSLSGLSEGEIKSVELAEFLLTAAENVGDGNFEKARNLLTECDLKSSPSGGPVQRLVYYFSRALRDRIARQTGEEMVPKSASFHDIMMPPRECFLEFYEKVPFGQVSEFAAIQAVVDSVAKATKIHIVDFNIKNGEQWTIFMQALVSREENPVDHLKITAIGTSERDALEETSKRLIDFAEAMTLSFSFNLIMVEDFMDVKEDMFEVDCEETVAVLVEYLLSTLISQAEKLEYLMKVIRELNPCVMVVTEVESHQNSPVFFNRFIETLFYASVSFDCCDICMDRGSPLRKFAESRFYGESIRIVVATEGEERVMRSVKMDTWRVYFRRFGMEEADLSFSCMYQAELVAKKFHSWRFCTVGLDGKSLIVGWKGTPTLSVTAWKFTDTENEAEEG